MNKFISLLLVAYLGVFSISAQAAVVIAAVAGGAAAAAINNRESVSYAPSEQQLRDASNKEAEPMAPPAGMQYVICTDSNCVDAESGEPTEFDMDVDGVYLMWKTDTGGSHDQ